MIRLAFETVVIYFKNIYKAVARLIANYRKIVVWYYMNRHSVCWFVLELSVLAGIVNSGMDLTRRNFNHPSFNVYIETINEMYYKYFR